MNERPTPETNAFAYLVGRELANNRRDLAAQAIAINELITTHVAKIERERDEARETLRSATQDHDRLLRENFAFEKQLKAMREAIKEAHEALMLAPYRDYQTIAKLQPFLA